MAIKMAKKQHWDDFLEGLSSKDHWTAQRYATNPVGDGGKARIPTLKVADSARHIRSVTTNEEKSSIFSQIFFPKHPADNLIPANPDYPYHIEYSFQLPMIQFHRCIVRLSPYKAPREDSIPNVIIKELLDLITQYLRFSEPLSHSTLTATAGRYGTPSYSTNLANQDKTF